MAALLAPADDGDEARMGALRHLVFEILLDRLERLWTAFHFTLSKRQLFRERFGMAVSASNMAAVFAQAEPQQPARHYAQPRAIVCCVGYRAVRDSVPRAMGVPRGTATEALDPCCLALLCFALRCAQVLAWERYRADVRVLLQQIGAHERLMRELTELTDHGGLTSGRHEPSACADAEESLPLDRELRMRLTVVFESAHALVAR
jgi:hypothetical protein